MGCGVSKEDIREPSRIQTVVGKVGSPESHLKAHEAALQQNQGLVSLVATQCKVPAVCLNHNETSDLLLQTSTNTVNDGLQALVEFPLANDDIVTKGDIQILPQCSPTTNPSCNKTPQEQEVEPYSPLFCCSNGLVGTLAGLDEILGTQEAGSLKLAIKVTAEKIMSFGGVLHSLEDQVGDFSYPLKNNGDTPLELENYVEEKQKILGLANENYDRLESSTITTSPKPLLEGFRKKLPPIITPPNSSLFDKSLITDPFVKTPFPIHFQPRRVDIEDFTEEPPSTSPQLPHTSEMVAVDSVKDILVMDGASYNYEECQNPNRRTVLVDLKCDVEKTILVETLEAQDTTHVLFGSKMHTTYENMSTSIHKAESAEKNGLNTNSPLTPFSTSSHRIEYLEEGDIKPISSDEFYS